MFDLVFIPPCSFQATKSDCGRPVHYTGSLNYPGAAQMCAVSAARAGSDYVIFRGICADPLPPYIIRDDRV